MSLERKTPLKRTAFKPKEQKPPAGPRKRLCQACKTPFLPFRGFETWCSPHCGLVVAEKRVAKQKAKQQRQERAETKSKLLELEPLEYFLKKAERACNAYIRARDAGKGCISCGRHDADKWNAGHFISVGANRTLRFEEDNIHLQCARPCNKDKGGNIVEYRKALIKKIGLERVEWLEGWHPPVKRTREKVEAIEAYYKRKLKELQS
jgi:hypothetical protein